MRAAGALSIFTGLGFGLPALYGGRYLAENGEVWEFLGFPTYGGGPFESVGIETTPGLMYAFAAVCAAEVGVGVMLWRGDRRAKKLSLGLLPFEIPFWIGFALPFGPVLGAARSALVLRG